MKRSRNWFEVAFVRTTFDRLFERSNWISGQSQTRAKAWLGIFSFVCIMPWYWLVSCQNGKRKYRWWYTDTMFGREAAIVLQLYLEPNSVSCLSCSKELYYTYPYLQFLLWVLIKLFKLILILTRCKLGLTSLSVCLLLWNWSTSLIWSKWNPIVFSLDIVVQLLKFNLSVFWNWSNLTS